MQLPAELVSLAVRGINGQAVVNQTSAQQTLQGCVIHSLQCQAGFIPAQDKHTLDIACEQQSTQHIEPESLKYLNIILKSHSWMLQEWIQAVCSVEKTIPDEYIPYFLTLGYDNFHLQGWLKLVMSDKAQWMVDHYPRDEWNWYNRCEVKSVDDLITIQNNSCWMQAHDIHLSLSTEPIGNGHHRGLVKLTHYPLMWRQQTAKLLIEAMFVANATASFASDGLMIQVVNRAVYHLPLNYADEFLETLRMGHEAWQSIADMIEEKFALRFDMLQTILGGNQ